MANIPRTESELNVKASSTCILLRPDEAEGKRIEIVSASNAEGRSGLGAGTGRGVREIFLTRHCDSATLFPLCDAPWSSLPLTLTLDPECR